MKGEWVYDQQRDIWHLIWDRNHPHNEAVGEVAETVAWCGFTQPSEVDVTKSGEQINGLSDAVHDDCYRKSQEL